MVQSSRGAAFPERIGRYDVLAPIASGGMGTVYLARTKAIGGFERHVALKLVHPHLQSESEFSNGLLDEAKLAARIRHPNVVSVLDVGHDAAGVYLVMDYVEGAALSALMRAARAEGQPLPSGVGLRIVTDALAGLHAAHELEDRRGRPIGVVHRDFSPQNVLVGLDGIGRLTDFGVAKAATKLSRTSTGTIKGKLAYMSPEHARAERVDRRSDVWSAGVVLWEVIADRRLFSGTEAQVILSIVSGDVPPLSRFVPDVPPALEAAIGAALSLDPRRRPATASELRSTVAAAARGRFALADTASVAAEVERLIGPALAERRLQLQEPTGIDRRVITVVRADEPERSISTERKSKPERLTRRSAIAIGLAGMSVGAVVSFLAVRAADGEQRDPPRAANSAPPSTTLIEPVASGAETPATAPLPDGREIALQANLPIAKVEIDGREHAIEPPDKHAEIVVSDTARSLTAVSSDGRRAPLRLSADRLRAVARFDVKPPVVRAGRKTAKPDPLSGYNPYVDGGSR